MKIKLNTKPSQNNLIELRLTLGKEAKKEDILLGINNCEIDKGINIEGSRDLNEFEEFLNNK